MYDQTFAATNYSGGIFPCFAYLIGTIPTVMIVLPSNLSLISGGVVKVHEGSTGFYLSAESSNQMQFGSSSYDSRDFSAKMPKDRSMEVFTSVPSADHTAVRSMAMKPGDPGGSGMASNVNKPAQVLLKCENIYFNYFLPSRVHLGVFLHFFLTALCFRFIT